MATLKEEMEADLFREEIENDLLEKVKWGDYTVLAMVEIVGVNNEFESFGGSEFSAIREFTFRRTELLRLDPTFKTFGKAIVYQGRTYDINEDFDRGEHPKVIVIGTLRNKNNA